MTGSDDRDTTTDWATAEADPADVAEQHTAPSGELDPNAAMQALWIADDQPEADVLEQFQDVPDGEDDYR